MCREPLYGALEQRIESIRPRHLIQRGYAKVRPLCIYVVIFVHPDQLARCPSVPVFARGRKRLRVHELLHRGRPSEDERHVYDSVIRLQPDQAHETGVMTPAPETWLASPCSPLRGVTC